MLLISKKLCGVIIFVAMVTWSVKLLDLLSIIVIVRHTMKSMNTSKISTHMVCSYLIVIHTYLVLEYKLRVVRDSTLDADGTVDIGLMLCPPIATPPREHRKPDMLVHSVMMCCRSSSIISGMCGCDERVLELLPILRLYI